MSSVTALQEPVTEVQARVTFAHVWHEALRLWHGDEAAARRFLNRPHPLLGGRTPLAVARESSAGAKRVVKLIGAARAGVAV